MVLDGTGSVYDYTGWYLVSKSWYCFFLGGTGSARGLYAFIYWKKWRFGRVLPMPDTLTHSQTEDRATQLVSSIKFKLSHAIQNCLGSQTQILIFWPSFTFLAIVTRVSGVSGNYKDGEFSTDLYFPNLP